MMRLKRSLFALLPAACLVGLAYAASSSYTVQWKGSLRAVHGGDYSPVVDLQAFEGKAHWNAVGPVAELDGEVTVIDGVVSVARVRGDDIVVSADLSAQASFLVWAEVEAWAPPVELGVGVADQAALEQVLEDLAFDRGIDVAEPFPFKLEGVFDAVEYHVLAPVPAGATAAHHLEFATIVRDTDVTGTMIGFFSRQHHGVFVHRGSSAHIHVIEENGRSGHVDALAAGPAVKVYLPTAR
jgi:acetolactate decarboxylase